VASTPILDAGCGTGLAGDCLRVLGYGELVGIDLSEPMLAHAARLGIYAALRPMILERIRADRNLFPIHRTART
jgi:predicted TPR repeat methyltransferase